jgi:Uma2 family endonuclease
LTAAGIRSLVEEILDKPTVVPVGVQEGRVAARLTWRLAQHVDEGRLGEVYTAGTGFVLSDGQGKLRSPDLAFVSRERLQEADAPGFFRQGPPDLVAEILSPSTSASALKRDVQAWLKAGTKAVLIVDSADKTVSVYRGGQAPEVAKQGGVLDLSDVVAGWSLRVDDLFN